MINHIKWLTHDLGFVKTLLLTCVSKPVQDRLTLDIHRYLLVRKSALYHLHLQSPVPLLPARVLLTVDTISCTGHAGGHCVYHWLALLGSFMFAGYGIY